MANHAGLFRNVVGKCQGLVLVGDELAWPGPGGKSMTVRVKDILYQPESAGELHR